MTLGTAKSDDLTARLAVYEQQLSKRGSKNSKGITIPAAKWLYDFATGEKIRQVAELGSGFSTLVFAMAMARRPDLRLITADHDQNWSRFVIGLVDAALLPRIEVKPLNIFFDGLSRLSHCDLIFVDHGPTYAARLKAVPALVQLSRRLKTSVVFDDWFMSDHPEWSRYSKDLVKALEVDGARCETIPGTALKGRVGPSAKHLGRLVY